MARLIGSFKNAGLLLGSLGVAACGGSSAGDGTVGDPPDDGGPSIVVDASKPDASTPDASTPDASIPMSYKIGGTVTGLDGAGLVLKNNGTDDLSVNANGSFAFATSISTGAPYSVSVSQPPTNKSQTCTVTNGAGSVGTADVVDVAVTCVTNTFTIGGTATGLAPGNEVVLTNNAGDDLTVPADGSFTFASPIESGASFSVAVKTQPTTPNQTCVVTGESGTVGADNVASVSVNCTTNTYTAGGTVNGLSGTGLVLQNNLGGDLPVSSTSFAMAPQADGTAYAISVKSQPTSPSQTCTVSNGAGTLAGADVTSAVVTCVTDTFSVGGTVTGLSGTIVLTNNGGDDLPIATNGPFTFTTAVASGAPYGVAVKTQPAGLVDCVVANGAGTVTSGNVATVAITCGPCTSGTADIYGSDHIDFSYGGGQEVWRGSNFFRAYTGSGNNLDLTGWVRFSLASLPANASVREMTFNAWAETVQSSPTVRLQYSASTNNWTNAGAAFADLPRTNAEVSAPFVPALGAYNAWPVSFANQSYAADFADKWITFGVDNSNPNYSYAYFSATNAGDPAKRPYLRVKYCQ